MDTTDPYLLLALSSVMASIESSKPTFTLIMGSILAQFFVNFKVYGMLINS